MSDHDYTPKSKFGSKPEISDKFIKKVCSNNELIDKMVNKKPAPLGAGLNSNKRYESL